MKIYNFKGTLLADSENKNFFHANLSGANLLCANLSGANLSEANLTSANLHCANLSGANLRGADLRWANLSGVNLRWADLTEANLTGANLTGANLSGATLTGTNLSGAMIRNTIGDLIEIKSLQLEKYIITFTKDVMAIGCKQYTIKKWFKFSDKEISDMDNGALEWWKKWKDYIKLTVELSKGDVK